MAAIRSTCRKLASLLAAADMKVVFAESCTAGLVSASLATAPGISAWHCGSAVTYRGVTKTAWLGISPRVLKKHGEVSETVARKMASGVLAITPEADIAASVTGHLGPQAPADQDGLIYVGLARRNARGGRPAAIAVHEIWLTETTRIARQHEAALCVLNCLCELLS